MRLNKIFQKNTQKTFKRNEIILKRMFMHFLIYNMQKLPTDKQDVFTTTT